MLLEDNANYFEEIATIAFVAARELHSILSSPDAPRSVSNCSKYGYHTETRMPFVTSTTHTKVSTACHIVFVRHTTCSFHQRVVVAGRPKFYFPRFVIVARLSVQFIDQHGDCSGSPFEIQLTRKESDSGGISNNAQSNAPVAWSDVLDALSGQGAPLFGCVLWRAVASLLNCSRL